MYANADKELDAFNDKLVFETTLVEVPTETEWISGTLQEIKSCLDADTLPQSGDWCEYCPYREAAGKKLQAIHFKNK